MLDRLIFTGCLFDIQRFADGSGAGAGAAGAGGAPAPASSQQGGGDGIERQPTIYTSDRKTRRLARQQGMPVEGVQPTVPSDYGTAQPQDEPEPAKDTGKDTSTSGKDTSTSGTDQPAEQQARKPLRQLMEEDPQYKLEFQEMFNKRYKDNKSRDAFIEQMHALYGTTDMDALSAKLNDDSDFWQYMADVRGMTKDQLKEDIRKSAENARLRRENAELKGITDNRDKPEDRKATVDALKAEGQQLAQKYPGFDLLKELQDAEHGGEFKDLMKMFQSNGFSNPVERAYQMVHLSEIMSETAAQTAQTTQQRVTQTIQAKGSRPRENGASSPTQPPSMFDGMQGRSAEAKARRAELARRALS